LGTMLEADRLGLAERYFADDELFEQLLVVETDLLDQYVRGELTPEERMRFERYLLRLPDHRHKIGVAKALSRVISEKQPTAATLPEPNSATLSNPTLWGRGMLAPAMRSQVVMRYWAVVLLMVSGIAIVWLVIYSRQLGKENGQLRAKVTKLAANQQALEEHTKISEQQKADQQAQIGQLQKDLNQEQQRNKVQAQQIARLQALSPSTISVEMTAASRIMSVPDNLNLPPGAKFVSLIIPIEGRKKYNGYRAVIQ